MRTKDFDKWLDTILGWSEKTEKKVLDKCNWITKKVLYTTVNFSPTQPAAKYSTGYFMHNWLLSSNGTKSLSVGTATKQSKKTEINSFISPEYFKNNRHLYMTNITPYSHHIEYMGWKVTGPYKPVAMTDAMMKTIKL